MSPLIELKRPLILGSSSPRRQGMLKSLKIPFKTLSPQTEEQHRNGESPEDYVRRNCLEKAQWVSKHQNFFPQALILAADTIVVLANEVLEKPRGLSDAKLMLEKLSGRTHKVLSAFCLYDTELQEQGYVLKSVETEVTFRSLLPQDISFYLSTQEPYDKAGSYSIQGIGSFLVEQIKGSHSNVIGLPLAEFLKELRELSQ